MYLYDFYKIFTKCLCVYHLKNAKNWGSPCWLRSGRPKCKLPSQLRKIVKATKRYGVKAMNLSARSNILGNIVNALEMILNYPRKGATVRVNIDKGDASGVKKKKKKTTSDVLLAVTEKL